MTDHKEPFRSARDVVDRLRDSRAIGQSGALVDLMDEAADEIERLRAVAEAKTARIEQYRRREQERSISEQSDIWQLREALEQAATHIQVLHRGLAKAGWGGGTKAAPSEIKEAGKAFSKNRDLWGNLRDIARQNRKP